MIHKLDIHSGGASVITEDLAGSEIARRLESLSRKILKHLTAVSCGTIVQKCRFAFRVCMYLMSWSLNRCCGWDVMHRPMACMQLLPDSSPVFIGCDLLRTESIKAFTINSMGSGAKRLQQHSCTRSFANLVSEAQLPEARLSREYLQEPLNVSHDGKSFTCAITGITVALHR